jgi:hypothetical protein
MIPILLLIGLLAGRWYVVGIAAVAWPHTLGLDGTLTGYEQYLGAAALAMANTAVGVAVHKAVVWPLRLAWGKTRPRVG